MKERLKIFLKLTMDALLIYLSFAISIYIIDKYFLVIENQQQIYSYIPYLIGIKLLVFLLFLFYSEEPNRRNISTVLGVISANLASLAYLYYQEAYVNNVILYSLITLLDLLFILSFRLLIYKTNINKEEIISFVDRTKDSKNIKAPKVQNNKSQQFKSNVEQNNKSKHELIEKKSKTDSVPNNTLDINAIDCPAKAIIEDLLKNSNQNPLVEKEEDILKRIKEIEKKEDIIEKTITNLEEISKNIKHRIKILEEKENLIKEKMKLIDKKEKEYEDYKVDKQLYDTIFNAPDTLEDEIKIKDYSKEIIIDKNDLLEIRNMIEQVSK